MPVSIPVLNRRSGPGRPTAGRRASSRGTRFDAPAKAAYAKFPNPASRYAMAGVFVAKAGDGGVRVAVTGAGSNGVFRHAGLEAALAANWSPEAASGVDVDAADLLSDLHGSAEYRANLVKVMAKRAVAAACRICMPPAWIDRLPQVIPWSGVSSVSPSITRTRSIGTDNSSAAICASAVRTPVPRSTLPEYTVTKPLASMARKPST